MSSQSLQIAIDGNEANSLNRVGSNVYAFEILKSIEELTRKNTTINQETIHQFIDNLNVDIEIKKELKKINPSNYTGI